MSAEFSIADDLSRASLIAIAVVLALALGGLLFELARRRSGRLVLLASGAVALGALALAMLRPVRVFSRESRVGPRVVVLLDRSRRLLLPAEREQTRESVLRKSVQELAQKLLSARLTWLGFGRGEPTPLTPKALSTPRDDDSDLTGALASLARGTQERPDAVVVVSDGRLARPPETALDPDLARSVAQLGVPVHSVSLTELVPRDAALRSVQNVGAAVAHQPLTLRIEVACTGGLRCTDIPVQVRELRQAEAPAVLAEGVAAFEGKDTRTLELSVTLERAGPRIVEVSLRAPEGDQVPENDRRLLALNVVRDRVRLLHVAGRPTYDVRSLRMWLKGNESVDLVAFFILRTRHSDPMTTDDNDELALIPFPVRALFTEHLPSFDAVILQDIDAVTYELSEYLPALEAYARSGGGIIMVGGPSAFAGGGYARSALERVLPTGLGDPRQPYDLAEFSPRYTEAGRVAPVLGALREHVAEDLPRMAGTNLLGAARSGAIVLWEHPTKTINGAPMPVLALGDAGDGRTIALAVDGTHQLAFSEFAERAAGRAYGALWDGLLGWLMRDPRYEAVRMELAEPCMAGEETRLRLTHLPGASSHVELSLEALGEGKQVVQSHRASVPSSGVLELKLNPLPAGGYAALAKVGQAPPTRFDFACERGGSAWGDVRPDADRLERIARVSGGVHVRAQDVSRIPLPEPSVVSAQREVSPVLPAWVWSLLASMALGGHWIVRRRLGLA